MKLKEIIEILQALPPNQKVKSGFCCPHSYRGHYRDLAFEPCKDTTVGKMLAEAQSAVGAHYTGWKGGEFLMTDTTPCYLAVVGYLGIPITSQLLYQMLGASEAEEEPNV